MTHFLQQGGHFHSNFHSCEYNKNTDGGSDDGVGGDSYSIGGNYDGVGGDGDSVGGHGDSVVVIMTVLVL